MMVKRNINYKIGGTPTAYLQPLRDGLVRITQVSVEWTCHSCGKDFPDGSAAVVIGIEGKTYGVYLCPACAEKALEKMLDEVKCLNNLGVDGYKLMKDI
jgi:ribosomal protein L37AE/L43A